MFNPKLAPSAKFQKLASPPLVSEFRFSENYAPGISITGTDNFCLVSRKTLYHLFYACKVAQCDFFIAGVYTERKSRPR